MNELISRIQKKEAVVGVIGLDYIGLSTAIKIANSDFTVIGIDMDSCKVEMINEGKNYINDIDNEDFKQTVMNKEFSATVDFSNINMCDVVLICISTPIDEYLKPDIEEIIKTAEKILKFRKRPSLIILESTVYPGTTEEIIKPILEKDGSLPGKDLFLAFSPERVDKKYKKNNIPKIIGGCTEECNQVCSVFYNSVLSSGVHTVSLPRIAEMEKLLENIFKLVNIGLINEMTVIANKMNIDIWEVIDASKTKLDAFMPFYPGPGLSEICIPIDPFYLSWKAKKFNSQTTLIEVANQTNKQMPGYIVNKIGAILTNNKKNIINAKIVILGVAYKKDVRDYRKSPTLKIHQLLMELKADVILVDPYIKEFKGLDGNTYNTTEVSDAIFKESDLVVIITDHSLFNESQILNNANLIYDTKNFIKQYSSKIIKL